MTLKQFITMFHDVGILDNIDITCGIGIDVCRLDQSDWRTKLNEFLNIWGDFEIDHFVLLRRQCGNAMAMSFTLKT